MPYKDPEKRKQVKRESARRRRNVDPLPCRPQNVDPAKIIATPTGKSLTQIIADNMPTNYGQPDCQCRHCRNNRKNGSKFIINHGAYKTFEQLADNEVNRVSLPGDVDYSGVASH